MARPCSVCSHPARTDIEAALGRGMSIRAVAGRFGVSRSSLDRHIQNGHAPAGRDLQALSGEVETVLPIPAHDDPFRQLKALREASLDALNASRRRGDDGLSIAWSKEMRALLQAEIEGQNARIAFENSREGAKAALEADAARRNKLLSLASILHDKLLDRARAAEAASPLIEANAVAPEAPSQVRRRSRTASR